jgi:chaperonin cofactor prefoldin
MLYRNKETKPPVVTGEKVEKFEKSLSENEPVKKPLEKIPEDDINVSMKKLHEVIAESNKRQEEILKAIQGLKKTDEEVHGKLEKTEEQLAAEEKLKLEKNE